MVTKSPKTSATKDNNLYERDYYLWLEIFLTNAIKMLEI